MEQETAIAAAIPGGTVTTAETTASHEQPVTELLVDELLVDEISIDGMCGVY